MTDKTFLLNPNEVELDPNNPPGRTRNTTDLQVAMLAIGKQVEPIVVRLVDDKYHVVSGNRRVVACRQLGWQVRAILEEDADENAAALMGLAANVHQGLTPTEKAEKLHEIVALGNTLNVARQALGLEVNEARILTQLHNAPDKVKKKVDSGKMSFSAFDEWRKAPPEVKEKLADKDEVTARAVQQERRKARAEKAGRLLDDEAHLVKLVQDAQRGLTVLRNAAPYKNGTGPQLAQGLNEIARLVEEIGELL